MKVLHQKVFYRSVRFIEIIQKKIQFYHKISFVTQLFFVDISIVKNIQNTNWFQYTHKMVIEIQEQQQLKKCNISLASYPTCCFGYTFQKKHYIHTTRHTYIKAMLALILSYITYIHTYIHTYTYTHTYIHIDIYIHTHIHVHT